MRINDVALLKVEGTFASLPLAASNAVKLGESVFTVGFPNPGVQGMQPKLTRGEISSLTGVRDDPGEYQISVPVQPGNSGGAVVDEYGNVTGLVSARLSDQAALVTSGMTAQDVNYAVKSSCAQTLLEAIPGSAGKLKPPHPLKVPQFCGRGPGSAGRRGAGDGLLKNGSARTMPPASGQIEPHPRKAAVPVAG